MNSATGRAKRPGIPRLAILSLSCLATSFGCGRAPTAPQAAVPPHVPTTPVAVADYFQWCWRNRSPSPYRLILPEDYRFLFATGDSAGDSYRTTPWSRTDELLCAVHLFRDGVRGMPPANSITLDYTQDPVDDPDPRGMNPKWHRLVTLQVLLRINSSVATQEVRGPVYFYVVRGDSAQIPIDLVAAGVRADSSQWWLQQWVDGTLQGSPPAPLRPGAGPLQTMPARNPTWGGIKVLYR